jgi:hypothetical protein
MKHKNLLALCFLIGSNAPAHAFTAVDDIEALALFEGYTDAANGGCVLFENPLYDAIVWDVFAPQANAMNETGLYPVGAGAFRMHAKEVGLQSACAELEGFISGDITFDKRQVAARNTSVRINW